jgi:hypothetical protein
MRAASRKDDLPLLGRFRVRSDWAAHLSGFFCQSCKGKLPHMRPKLSAGELVLVHQDQPDCGRCVVLKRLTVLKTVSALSSVRF